MSGLKSSGSQLHNFIASRLEMKVSDIWNFSDSTLRHFYLEKTGQFDDYKMIVDCPEPNLDTLLRIAPDHVDPDYSLGYIAYETRKFYLLEDEIGSFASTEYSELQKLYTAARQRMCQAIGRGIRIPHPSPSDQIDALTRFWHTEWLKNLYAQNGVPVGLSVSNPHVVIVDGHQPDFVPFKAEISTSYKPAKEAEQMQEKYIPQVGDYFTFEGQQQIHQCINAGILNRMSPTALCENIMDGERSLYYPDSGSISKANPTELSLQLHVKRFATVAEEIERGNVSPDELATATMSILESFAGEVVDRHKSQFANSFTQALRDVAEERNRQILKGYNYQNDDDYIPEILLQMGVSYAVSAISNHAGHRQRSLGTARRFWPFNHHSNFQTGNWFGRVQTGSKEQRTRLVKACALIMAEIEKMDRKESK